MKSIKCPNGPSRNFFSWRCYSWITWFQGFNLNESHFDTFRASKFKKRLHSNKKLHQKFRPSSLFRKDLPNLINLFSSALIWMYSNSTFSFRNWLNFNWKTLSKYHCFLNVVLTYVALMVAKNEVTMLLLLWRNVLSMNMPILRGTEKLYPLLHSWPLDARLTHII